MVTMYTDHNLDGSFFAITYFTIYALLPLTCCLYCTIVTHLEMLLGFRLHFSNLYETVLAIYKDIELGDLFFKLLLKLILQI